MSLARLHRTLVTCPDARIRASVTLTRVAIITGVIWIPAGLVKFVFHHWELHAFISFGLPAPGALEILAGVLETLGGGLLLARRWVVPTAVLLAATMVVAIIASGIGHGDVIPSLTLAPALLLAMLWLLAAAWPGSAERAVAHRDAGSVREPADPGVVGG